MQLPILRDVDLLIVGSSTGAAAAALEAQRLGKSVMLVSDLAYLGEETAGTLNLWPASLDPSNSPLDRSDPLIQSLFPSDTAPVFPGLYKNILETTLLRAHIPLLYLSRPIALLRDDSNTLTGAILAARTSLFVVTCRTIIDATRYGVVARLASAHTQKRTQLPAFCNWTILSEGAPEGFQNTATEILPPIRQRTSEKPEQKTFNAFRLRLEHPAASSDDATRSFAHLARAYLVSPNLLTTADIIPTTPDIALPGATAEKISSLADSQFRAAPNIFALSQILPLSLSALASFERADVQVAAARRVAALAVASTPAKIPAQNSGLSVLTGGTTTGNYRFADAFLRQATGTLTLNPLAFPSLGSCDVAVAGGGTGGAPAGIAAARAGAKTVVLEIQYGLGGVGTIGLISRYWFGNKVGFTQELNEAVMQFDAEARSQKGVGWSPEIKTAIYHRMLRDAGGTAWLGAFAFGVRLDGNRVNALLVSTPNGCGLLEAGSVVDATGNADIAAAAGAPCRVIDARHVATQGTGLSPRLFPGVRYQNSDHTFVDETDPEGVTHAFLHTRAKFSDHFDVASIVDTRERRQILGEAEISPLDIMAQRTFPDTVFTACSNFDTHGFIVHPLFMMSPPDHKPVYAHVPFRCMLPRNVEGVLVTGLGMSAHRDALPVIRMQADVQNQGFAAGLAASTAARSATKNLRDLDIPALQRELAKLKILAPDVPSHKDSFPLSASAIAAAANGDLGAVMNAAIVLAHPDQSRPTLLQILNSTTAEAPQRLNAAILLGLMGEPAAAPLLAETLHASSWDKGWNYRGMGQFGESMSRLDTIIIALARTASPLAVDAIEEKINQLTPDSEFSHTRAVGLATAKLKHPRLAQALYNFLQKPGITGHAHLRSLDLHPLANNDPTETKARNVSLREIYLARGLFIAGDIHNTAQKILETYTHDLRGHYARHARALLDSPHDLPILDLA